MGCPEDLRPDMSVTDLAYRILKARGAVINFKELINEVLAIKPIAGENRGKMIAQINTEINLDSRFIHQGQGVWGLRDWQPKGGTKVVRLRPASAQPSRTRAELMSEEDALGGDEDFAREEGEEEEEEEEETAFGAEDTFSAEEEEDEEEE